MRGHGDDTGTSDARTGSPAGAIFLGRSVVDSVRTEEQNNTRGLPVGARAHTTNEHSKLHGRYSGNDGDSSYDARTGFPAG